MPSPTPTVSAIIPAHNARLTICRALDSVLAQRPALPLEIVVVDDASTDGTGELVAQRYPVVQVLYREQSTGVAGPARNAGVAACSGELLAFLDADDEWHPQRLALQLEVMERESDCVLVACLPDVVAEGASVPPMPPPGESPGVVRAELRNWAFWEPGLCDGVYPSGWLARRDVLVEADGFGASRGEDFDLLLRLTARGHRVSVLQARLFRYYRSHTTLTGAPGGKCQGLQTAMDHLRCLNPVSGADWARGLLTEQEFCDAMCKFGLRQFRAAIAYGCWDYQTELLRELAVLDAGGRWGGALRRAQMGLAAARAVLDRPGGARLSRGVLSFRRRCQLLRQTWRARSR